MPDLTVSSAVDGFMRSANPAQMRSSLGNLLNNYAVVYDPKSLASVSGNIFSIPVDANTVQFLGDALFMRFFFEIDNSYVAGNLLISFGSTVLFSSGENVSFAPGNNYIIEIMLFKTTAGASCGVLVFSDDGSAPLVLNSTVNSVNFGAAQNLSASVTGQSPTLTITSFLSSVTVQPA